MKCACKLLFLISLILLVSAITITASLQTKSPNVQASAVKRAEEDFYTTADFTAPEPADPKERESRRVRARRYNMRADKGIDPSRFAITEERQSAFGLTSSHAPIEPALPAAQSDAVIVGEITNAEAFLTEDKTGVISEFNVRVNDILKENLIAPFSVGDSLDVMRPGGGVRFASGKAIRYGSDGKPLPRLGRRYLFFLKYNADSGSDYVILTAYELRSGQVVPLDGVGLSGNVAPPYAEYQKFNGFSEADFREKVVDAVARNLGSKADVQRLETYSLRR